MDKNKNNRNNIAGTATGDERLLSEIKSLPPKQPKKKTTRSWSGWKSTIKALTHIGHRRLNCQFSLHVQFIKELPDELNDLKISVKWRSANESTSSYVSTRPAIVCSGIADFDETLTYGCTVYVSNNGSAKYESRVFIIIVYMDSGIELGQHRVDLTRLLPVKIEELEDEAKGNWSTTFQLYKGAKIHVRFGYYIVRDAALEVEAGKTVSDGGIFKRLHRHGSLSLRRSRTRRHDRSWSVDDVKILHEVLPCSQMEDLPNNEIELKGNKFYESDEVGTLDKDLKQKCRVSTEIEEAVVETKICYLSETVEEIEGSLQGEHCLLPEPDDETKQKVWEGPEFMVMEPGVELDSKDIESNSELQNDGISLDNENDKADKKEANTKLSEPLTENCSSYSDSEEYNFSTIQLKEFDTQEMVDKLTDYPSFSDTNLSPSSNGSLRRSCSLDDATESVADEFLSMLGKTCSPLGLSSDSDTESPRELLWQQFQKETLITSDALFDVESPRVVADRECLNWEVNSDDFDLSKMVLEAEAELLKATETVECESRAKMLEAAETEALMQEWGFSGKVFQSSPPRSPDDHFDLPSKETSDLPPLGEGLGPFIRTKNGSFFRSMNPALFTKAKNNGNLVMQVSNPIVVPAEMGFEIMEILQCMASLGIEKLSKQAYNLMPLEDISGETLQQIAQEVVPQRNDSPQQWCPESKMNTSITSAGRRKKDKGSSSNLQCVGDTVSEYVSVEDLSHLAMDKIETLSIEGLRIQSGMSNEDAPSNVNAQFVGEFSALEGRGARNSSSLGLEGIAGLQLMHVSDTGDVVEGLMGLSITLDEWLRLDSGIVDDEDEISERTSKVLAAHHANSLDLFRGGWKGHGRLNNLSAKKWGLLGNNFTVALMVQLRDPLRNYEIVGAPMLSLIQVERVFVPPKLKICGSISERGNNKQENVADSKSNPLVKQKSEEVDVALQFKISEVHVAGLKTEPEKKKLWGNFKQQQSASRWLLATGMGKSYKHPLMKSKAATTEQSGDALWSISSHIHSSHSKWKGLGNSHIRNPNVNLRNVTKRWY